MPAFGGIRDAEAAKHMGSKTILVIVAHADDMEFMAGGTIAKMVSQGMEVHQLITTNNEKGSFTLAKEELVRKSREEEARAASKFLGLKGVSFLEYPDGELTAYPFNEIREKFMKEIRRIKPDVLLTWDPFAPYETHQDHRVVAMAATEAAEFAHLPLYHPEHKKEGLGPHYVADYLYFAKSPTDVNKIVDITKYIEKKIEALLMHKSQMELTVGEIVIAFKSAGVDLDSIGLKDDIQSIDFRTFIDMGIRTVAARAGEKIGAHYAEVFRYNSFGLAKQVLPDLFKDKEIKI